MDKLRALKYFLVSAEEHSFSRAARRLEVSVPAVAKLVAVLERELGAALFERSAQGLKLTVRGERYLDVCQPLLAQLTAADELVGEETVRPRGTLVVGAHPELVMLPWLSRFHERYPDIQIDLRAVTTMTIKDTPAEVYLVHGWPDQPDMVRRVVAQPRLLTCAAPAYWAAHGVPQRPNDLEAHVCLLYCNDEGTVNDLWQYERGQEKESVTARGWLVSNSRYVTINAALAGEGVVRISDLMAGEHLRNGQLVPTLLDWVMGDAPPFNVLFRSRERRNPRARVFIDFAIEAFGEWEAECGYGINRRQFLERPYWHRRRYRRASAATIRRE
jgi:LysR family transcriptional regulator for bpeEF and oprC